MIFIERPQAPWPRGLHALALLIAHLRVRDLARLAGSVEIVTAASLFDFS